MASPALDLDRGLPASPEAERSILGGVCFWQLGLAHFGSLIWPTPRNVEG
jgi:hypothetical protein